MPLIDDKQKKELQRHFEWLAGEVDLLFFRRDKDCDYCRLTNDLLDELVALSPKLKLQVFDEVTDEAEAKRYGVDKAPAIVVKGAEDYGIRFYGAPAGHEFTTFIEDILMVSAGSHGLSSEVLKELEKVDQPVRIQVMISPACPYCPTMVHLAHRFAMANKFITADMVEISEFPELIKRYEVQGVPHTMLGETYGVVGVYKELEFVQEVLRGIGKLPIEVSEHVHTHHQGEEHAHEYSAASVISSGDSSPARPSRSKKSAAGKSAKPARKVSKKKPAAGKATKTADRTPAKKSTAKKVAAKPGGKGGKK